MQYIQNKLIYYME